MKLNREKSDYSLHFPARAQQDIEEILQYTLSEWGRSQANKYKELLDHAFTTIQCNSCLGHRRMDIPAQHLAFQAG